MKLTTQDEADQANYQVPVTSGPRTLHVYSAGSFSKTTNIMDSDKKTILFSIQTHSWTSPDIEMFSHMGVQTGEPVKIGSVTFHSFSSSIDVVLCGQNIELSKNGTFASGHQWRSPAMGGVLVKWKTDGAFTSSRICYVDGHKDNPIARWERAGMATTKKGKIHILDPSLAVPGSAGFAEVVLSALIEVEVARRRSNSAAAGGGGAAAGGGC